MIIPYRTRCVLRRLGIASLVLLILFIFVWLCWVIWLERYIIYTREGAQIDFELTGELPPGQVALPPSSDSEIEIYFNEGENSVETSNELTPLTGYYIDTDMLSTNVTGAMDILSTLPSGTAVMIDVKSINGSFYYSSSLQDAMFADVDLAAVDSLIDTVINGDYYAIARIPAFRDYYYGLNHVSCGLSNAAWGEGYLWKDTTGCYWLNPANSGALNWIMSVIEELKRLGFDEVVLTDFRFPDTDNIIFSDDRDTALQNAMKSLFTNCSTNTFTLSFSVTNASFAVPEGRSRLYLENIDARNVAQVAAQTVVDDPAIKLVFIASTNDTRYDDYSVLRPLDSAKVLEEGQE